MLPVTLALQTAAAYLQNQNVFTYLFLETKLNTYFLSVEPKEQNRKLNLADLRLETNLKVCLRNLLLQIHLYV